MLRQGAAASCPDRRPARSYYLIGDFVLVMIVVAYLVHQVAHRTRGKEFTKAMMRKLCSSSGSLISSGGIRAGVTALGTLNEISHCAATRARFDREQSQSLRHAFRARRGVLFLWLNHKRFSFQRITQTISGQFFLHSERSATGGPELHCYIELSGFLTPMVL